MKKWCTSEEECNKYLRSCPVPVDGVGNAIVKVENQGEKEEQCVSVSLLPNMRKSKNEQEDQCAKQKKNGHKNSIKRSHSGDPRTRQGWHETERTRRSWCEVREEDCTKSKEGVHVSRSARHGQKWDVTLLAKHNDVLQFQIVRLGSRVCVGFVGDNEAVTTWTTVSTSWDKHADKMRMRKHVCAVGVLVTHSRNDEKFIDHSKMKFSTSPSSTLSTSRYLYVFVMTKWKWMRWGRRIVSPFCWSIKSICVFSWPPNCWLPLSDLLLWRDRIVPTSSECWILMLQSLARLLRIFKRFYWSLHNVCVQWECSWIMVPTFFFFRRCVNMIFQCYLIVLHYTFPIPSNFGNFAVFVVVITTSPKKKMYCFLWTFFSISCALYYMYAPSPWMFFFLYWRRELQRRRIQSHSTVDSFFLPLYAFVADAVFDANFPTGKTIRTLYFRKDLAEVEVLWVIQCYPCHPCCWSTPPTFRCTDWINSSVFFKSHKNESPFGCVFYDFLAMGVFFLDCWMGTWNPVISVTLRVFSYFVLRISSRCVRRVSSYFALRLLWRLPDVPASSFF